MHDYSSSQPFHKTPRHSIGFFYILPLGLVIGFFLFVGNFFLKGGQMPALLSATPKPTVSSVRQSERVSPTVSPSATPTPEAIRERDGIRIVVLNGSGEAGAAGDLADELRDLGYTTIRTGNADAYTYTGITIRSGETLRSEAERLERELEKTYTVKAEIEEESPEGADIAVIIGKDE